MPSRPTRSNSVAVFRYVRGYAVAFAATLLFCIILTGVAYTPTSSLTSTTIYGVGRDFSGGNVDGSEPLIIKRQGSAYWLLDQYEKIDRGDLESVEGLDGIGDYRVQNYKIATKKQRVDLRTQTETMIRKNSFIVLAQRTGKRQKKTYLYTPSTEESE